jgi:MFS family permease
MDPPPAPVPPPQSKSPRGVFAYPSFAILWTANTIALVGIAMYDAGSGWLMTEIDANPFDVALVHAATNLPMFLFTLPAGAIADIVDPRRFIIAISCAAAAMLAIFSVLVSLGHVTPLLLLLTTFLLSAAWSLNLPSWMSMLPSVVPRSGLAEAIAANGVAYNLSRTVGPALGGFAIVNFGISTPFWAFAAANLAVIAALVWLRTPRKETADLPAERLTSAIRVGVRHATHNRLLQATLVRTLAVYPFAAAYWGLLPLIARRTGTGAAHYGVLMSAISVGAIVGSLGVRHLRSRINLDWGVVLGTVGTAAALALFGSSRIFAVDLAACFCAGASWVVVLTTLWLSAQSVLPDWVRGRGLAVFLTVVFGATTVGSAAWGQVAMRIGLEQALFLSAAGILAAIPLSWRWKLQRGQAVDLSPSLHWRRPHAVTEIEDSRGPVLVKIAYRIDLKDRERFLRAMDELGYERKRDGAFAWGIFEDMGEHGRFEEGYLVESWLALMHLRERVTNEDRMLEDEIGALLTAPPQIEFLVAADRQPLRRRREDAAAGA